MKIAPFALSAIVGATTSKASGNERILKKADLSQSKVTSAGNIATAALTPRGGEIGHHNRGTLAVATRPHRQLQSLLDLSGAPVTASSVYGNQATYLGTKAFDNDTGTRWASKDRALHAGATVNEWLEVDLGETHDITKIDLYWENAYAREYEFQVSSDRTNWSVAHTETNSETANISFMRTSNFSANGRYVRFYGTEYGPNNDLYSIREMRIYGAAVAPGLLDLSGAPVTASSVYGNQATYLGTKAFDNDIGTRWASKDRALHAGATVNEWLEVDLGETHDITRIDLYWQMAHALEYEFQVSSDRTNWSAVHTEIINAQIGWDFTRTSNFSANGRYVRFYGTKYGNFSLYSIFEMKIYGTAAPAAPPPVTSSPSKSPTNTPTQSPTHSPWKLAHASGNAEYNKKDEDEGTVTSVWDYYSPLLSEDDNFSFVSNIKAELCSDGGSPNKVKVEQRSEGVLTDGNGVGVGVKGSCSSGPVTTSGQVSCVYRFDKSLMNSSVGYTPASGGSTANQQLCEIAQLQYKGMVLTEFYTDINVQFSLEAGFNVTGVEMTQATISTSNQETSLADYVSAAKCDGGDLGPNQILCIDVTSSSNDIKIETLDSMTMFGNAEEGGNSLVVVNRDDILTNNGIQYTSITSVENEGSGTVRIQTRAPTSTFNFQAPGAKLNINGAVTLKFADESRRLVALNRLLQANEDESAKFEVAITLQSEKKDLGLEGADTMMNSARATTGGKVFVIVGMAIASAFALW